MTDTPPDRPCQLAPFARSRQLADWPPSPQRDSGALATSNRGWRIRWPALDLATCSRCGLCFLYCPDAAILLSPEGYPAVADDWCKGCGLCAVECPKDSIRMSEDGEDAPP